MRTRTWLAIMLAVAVFFGVGGWGLTYLLSPPKPAQVAIAYDIITSDTGTVGRQLKSRVHAKWDSSATYPLALPGTVTTVSAAKPRLIKSGDVIASINLHPVTVATGTVPAFRTLSRGVKGKDVAQLQNLLRAKKYRSAAANSVFDRATVAQVKAWQKATKQRVTGSVPLGAIIFAPHLPSYGFTSPTTKVGATTPEPSVALTLVAAAPTLYIEMSESRSAMVPADAPITITIGDQEFSGRMSAERSQTSEGRVKIGVTTAESVTSKLAALIPPQGRSDIESVIIIVPETSGVRVPTSALQVAATGGVVVLLADGSEAQVTVLATVDGFAIVEGIEAGTKLRVVPA